jgi:hypothetical protein
MSTTVNGKRYPTKGGKEFWPAVKPILEPKYMHVYIPVQSEKEKKKKKRKRNRTDQNKTDQQEQVVKHDSVLECIRSTYWH